MVENQIIINDDFVNKKTADNNQCFVACEARTMKPLLNETGNQITAVCTVFLLWDLR